jgi:glycosyltransferase involved in cell wall biosynthesis
VNRPVRLAFVLPHLRPGGVERVVVNLLRALNRDRFAPFLFLAREEGAFLELLPSDVPVADLGGRARRLPRRIARAFEAQQIDVAYSATGAVNLALLASSWWGGGGTRRIVSEHTLPSAHLSEVRYRWVRRLLMRRLYPSADAIAVATEAIGADLKQVLRRPNLRTRALPNPVVDRPRRPDPRPPGGPPLLVSAGRLVEAKGFDLLIEAAALLVRRGVDFELVIHGEGPLRQSLAARIEAENLGARVALAGHAENPGAVFAAADLYVLPSRREGFGNVIVEAMAAGLPVLAAACSGPSGLIDDERNGFLVEPGDVAALADALARLVADADLRRSVVDQAYLTAQKYEVEGATRAFEQMVQDLVR